MEKKNLIMEINRQNKIHFGTLIEPEIHIGNNNIIGPYAVIGTPPQHKDHYQDGKELSGYGIKIGNNNVIREFVTIHQGTKRMTEIGNNCFLMAYTHIPHDAIIEDDVTIAQSYLAGHTHIMKGSNLGLNCSVHQYTTIGPYCMIGMGSSVVKDIPPFILYIEGKLPKINVVGLRRAGFSEEEIKEIRDFYENDVEPSEKIIEIYHSFEKCRDTSRPLMLW